jgi:heme/copper-type cytochrome/quinol oxidase subunit 2
VRQSRPPGIIAILAILAVASMACSPARTHTRPPDEVVWNPEPSVGPFVVVAVKNHFHDIHPYDQTAIAEDRPFIVKNQSYDLHNFTVVGTGISVDIKPLRELVWPRLGDKLKPGQYTVVCKYHEWAGMTGTFIVTP